MKELKPPRVDCFLIGTPKSGSTFLCDALSQNPSICVSRSHNSMQKEPNIISSHKGTFPRDDSPPNWRLYSECFVGPGIRLDASVHTMACEMAPLRIKEFYPNSRFIVLIREPVSRSISHWNMILDSGEDKRHGSDWQFFREAWEDPRLKDYSLYGKSLEKWLVHFDLERFLFITSDELRSNTQESLKKVESHIGALEFRYNLEKIRNSNSASTRLSFTKAGKTLQRIFDAIPWKIKRPISVFLANNGVNIYSPRFLSRPGGNKQRKPEDEIIEIVRSETSEDLALFSKITGIDLSMWFE